MTRDEEASPIYSEEIKYISESQALFDRVLTKAVTETSHFEPLINARLPSLVTAKLWRMGSVLAKKNSRQRKVLLERLKTMMWKLRLQPKEVKSTIPEEKENIAHELEKKGKKKWR